MSNRNWKLRVLATLMLVFILLPQVAFAESYKASPNRDPSSYSSSRPDKLDGDMLYATSAVAVDAQTGRVLFEKRADRKIYPASTTKVLTALLALENLDLDQTVTTSRSCLVGESSIYLSEGEEITVRDLLYGLMLKSGNDAAVALAEAVSGSVDEFADKMNARAQELGAVNSNFKNPHGLPNDNHYTTAQDYYKIVMEAMKHEEFMTIIGTRSYTLHSKLANGDDREYTISNTNKLLPNSGESFAYEYMLGGKTGYTDSAQSAFVGISEKDGVRVVTVVFGSTTEGKWLDTQKLAEYAFAAYQPLPIEEIYTANALTVQTENAQDPADASLELMLAATEEPLARPLFSSAEIDNLRNNFGQYATISYRNGDAVTAPVQQGEIVADLHIQYEDMAEIVLPLAASRMVTGIVATPTPAPTQISGATSDGITIVTNDAGVGGWTPMYLLVILPIVFFVILLIWLIVEIHRAKVARREAERRRRSDDVERRRAERERSYTQRDPISQNRPRYSERYPQQTPPPRNNPRSSTRRGR